MNTLKIKLNLKVQISGQNCSSLPTTNTKLSSAINSATTSAFEFPILSEKSQSKKECTHILNDIFLSGYKYSLDYDYLIENNFTHIINCAAGSKRFTSIYYDEFKYLALDVKDEPGMEIESAVREVIEFIEQADSECKHRRILIHCFEGISRGPTLLISYLMWKYQMGKDEAITYVKEKRPCVDINLGFMCQLELLANQNSKSREEAKDAKMTQTLCSSY